MQGVETGCLAKHGNRDSRLHDGYSAKLTQMALSGDKLWQYIMHGANDEHHCACMCYNVIYAMQHTQGKENVKPLKTWLIGKSRMTMLRCKAQYQCKQHEDVDNLHSASI